MAIDTSQIAVFFLVCLGLPFGAIFVLEYAFVFSRLSCAFLQYLDYCPPFRLSWLRRCTFSDCSYLHDTKD